MATAQSFVYLKKNRIEKVVVVVPTYRANSISVQRVQKTAFIHRLHTGKRNTRYQRSRNKCEKNPKVNILGFETTIKNGFERVFFPNIIVVMKNNERVRIDSRTQVCTSFGFTWIRI